MGNAKSSSELPRPKYDDDDDDDDESIRRWSLRRQAKKETDEGKSSTQFSLVFKVCVGVAGAMAGGVVGGLLALGALRLASSLRSPKLEVHVHIEEEDDDDDDDDDDDESIRWGSLHQQTKKEIKGENDESIRRQSLYQQTKKEIEGESSTQFSSVLKVSSSRSNDDIDDSIRRQSLHQQTKKEIKGEIDESIHLRSLYQPTKKEIERESSTQFSSVLKVSSSKAKKDIPVQQSSRYSLQEEIPPLEPVTSKSHGDYFPLRSKLPFRHIKIMSYNVWCREDVKVKKRMKVIGNLIKQHSLDIIFFQEVTPNIYELFERSKWWQLYKPSVLSAAGRAPFCMLLSKLRVEMFKSLTFSNSTEKELCLGVINVGLYKRLIVATSHLKCQTNEMTNSEERVSRAKEALQYLQQFPNVIFGGDMNWDEDEDGVFPLQGGWTDAWTELRGREPGWTFDTESNEMLKGRKRLQKRLDRFICKLEEDFRMMKIEMIGKEAIPGLTYCNEKGMVLPVFPSDHYGLILTISITIGINV